MPQSSETRTETPAIPSLTWLEKAIGEAASASDEGLLRVVIACSDSEFQQRCDALLAGELSWQKRTLNRDKKRVFSLATTAGPHVLVNLALDKTGNNEMFEWNGEYATARDLMGELFAAITAHNATMVDVSFGACSEAGIIGCLTGLELAAYDFRQWNGDAEEEIDIPGLALSLAGNPDFPEALVSQAVAQGHAINVARHLVNLPAGNLDPEAYVNLVQELFTDSDSVSIDIWDQQRLADENMGLILAVGKAAAKPPCLIHLRHQGSGATGRAAAFVGKGITFDTGGLDLKPSAFMRMMKKDMGGSAALLGLAVWLDKIDYPGVVDIWLAVAENAVGKDAFRPGDILVARNGRTIEIDNTDAEGRLVLADALTVAAAGEDGDKPEVLIDVATLTGAGRVALGLQVGALFANDRRLSDRLYAAGVESGDPLWPLPLVGAYQNELKSPVASLVNSSQNRFGGAITAALFLAEFVGDVPWAHLDVNAYANETQGAIKGPGANGQTVQCLIRYLENRSQH